MYTRHAGRVAAQLVVGKITEMERDRRPDAKRSVASRGVGVRLRLTLEAKPKLCKAGIKQ